MTYASPFLDPQLDAPQPVTRTHPLAGAVTTEQAGAKPLNTKSSDWRDTLLVAFYALTFSLPLIGVALYLHLSR